MHTHTQLLPVSGPSLLLLLSFFFQIYLFSITVDIQYYFILVSGAQHVPLLFAWLTCLNLQIRISTDASVVLLNKLLPLLFSVNVPCLCPLWELSPFIIIHVLVCVCVCLSASWVQRIWLFYLPMSIHYHCQAHSRYSRLCKCQCVYVHCLSIVS